MTRRELRTALSRLRRTPFEVPPRTPSCPKLLATALDSFLRFRGYAPEARIEHCPTWSADQEWLPELPLFEGFYWIRVRSVTDTALIGVRSIYARSPFTEEVLRESRATLYKLRSFSPISKVSRGSRYYIAESPGRTCFGISTYAWSLPDKWGALNERVIKLDPPAEAHQVISPAAAKSLPLR